MNRAYQSRLTRFHDNIRKKLTDNAISLTGQATDTLRIRLNHTKQGDIATRVIESTDVVPVVFPPLVDVPYRMLSKKVGEGIDATTGSYSIELSTVDNITELFPIEIMTTQFDKIGLGDLLFRVMDVGNNRPLVMVLEVVEMKGTFGGSNLIYTKLGCVYHNEALPQEILEYVAAVAQRRKWLQW